MSNQEEDLSKLTLARLAKQQDRSLKALRELRRSVTREVRALPGRNVLEVVERLLDADCPGWFAFEIAHHHHGAMNALTAARLKRLGQDLASWGEVDAFGCYLLGPTWREGRVSDAALESWARSKDRWRRRAALVATVALNTRARGGNGKRAACRAQATGLSRFGLRCGKHTAGRECRQCGRGQDRRRL